MFLQLSEELALARWYKNTEVRGSNTEFQRGSKEKELEIEAKGILGELIARYHLETIGKNYEAQELISETPLKEADIIIGDDRIDVKTSNLDLLMVNERAHNKGKAELDWYWFIVLRGLYADYYLFEVDEVDKWELRQLKFTKAYVKEI